MPSRIRCDRARDRLVIWIESDVGLAHPIPANTRLFVGNCGDAGLVGEVLSRHDVTTIMHFAGSISVSESLENPQQYHLVGDMMVPAMPRDPSHR